MPPNKIQAGSLANGRTYLAIPGPSVVPDRVLNAMHQGAPNIYSGALPAMVEGLIPDLKSLARTCHHAVIYISNGHGAWEAALANTLSRGDKVLALATGHFGVGWSAMATGLGARTEILDFGTHADLDLARVEETLKGDKHHEIKAITVSHVDTSTGVRNDIASLRATIDAAGHPALLMVDCIASLGCERVEMDEWGVDVIVAACQKGLMTPPGLGFVFFNDKADAARETADCVTHYWDWRPRAFPDAPPHYFGGTAPTHHIFALREALTMILHEEGLEAVLARHATLAQTLWAAVEAWGRGGPLTFNITDPAKRSHAVTALAIGAPNGTALRDWLSANAGVTLGIGLGMAPQGDPAWHGYFRVGHMGHLNAHMMMGVLGSIEAGMGALSIPYGAGGLGAAAKVIARV